MVVVAQRLISEVIDHGRITDHIALGVLCARIHLRVQLFPDTALCGTTGTPLLEDHAALGIDLLVQEQQTATPIAHHKQRAVNDAFAIRRYIRKTVNGLVNRGIGIDVSAEINTYRLKIIDDPFAGEMLCSVESHMLQEMRQTVLMILFEDSTYCLRNVELATLFRLLVVTDVIGQTVLQFAVTNIRVHRQFLCGLGPYHPCHSQQENRQSDFFHIVMRYLCFPLFSSHAVYGAHVS